ncbi:MAG: hypothetical protein IPP36_06695 [Nitrosomonadales bacterium]|nr:hypothetical protein [Nitrosomonadales bacterium]
MHQYFDRHCQGIGELDVMAPNNIELPKPQLFLRMALSCMVDADHGDTARHYGEAAQYEPYLLRPLERSRALDRYVSSLGSDTDDRAKARQAVYETCRGADTQPALYACDSPVGTGKTTAVMAHLLKAAHDKGLRRVFIVLPYTNIISQSVDVYRKALALDREKTDEVVVAHHHRAEFSAGCTTVHCTGKPRLLLLRQYSFLKPWRATNQPRYANYTTWWVLPCLLTKLMLPCLRICGHRHGDGYRSLLKIGGLFGVSAPVR